MDSIRDALHESLDRLEALYDDRGRLAMTSGIAAVDHALDGLWPGDLVLVAGPPSSAKTSMLVEISRNTSLNQSQHTLVLSGEATAGDVAERYVSRGALVPSQRIRSGKLTNRDWNRITASVALLSEAPLEIIGSCPLDLEAIMTHLDERDPVDRPRVIAVDSVHHTLAAATLPGTTAAGQQLKALALRCQATVIASVQVGSVDLDRLEALSLEHPGLTAIADSVLFVSTEAGGTGSTLDVFAAKRRRGRTRWASAVHVPEVGAVVDVPLDLPSGD
jgi:replicative DNA helicase